jgi:NitT/TauT family transport system permease protein
MFASLWTVLRSGDYSAAIWLTLRDIVLASAIAIAAGFVLGVTFHAQRFLRRGIEPFLASYYAVPTFIFYPVLIVVMGAGRAPVIAIAVALAIVAMITATLTGLDRIPPVLVKTARVMQLSPLQVMLQMQRPAVMPYLFTGIKLAVSYAVIGVIASEFILSGDGIGYAIAYAYNSFDNDTMYGLILFVVLVVSGLNSVLDIVDRRLQARLVD